MAEAEATERLAAILAADAAGYSRLMQDDERAAVATLDESRRVFKQHIEANRGRVVDMAGDRSPGSKSGVRILQSRIGSSDIAWAASHPRLKMHHCKT